MKLPKKIVHLLRDLSTGTFPFPKSTMSFFLRKLLPLRRLKLRPTVVRDLKKGQFPSCVHPMRHAATLLSATGPSSIHWNEIKKFLRAK